MIVFEGKSVKSMWQPNLLRYSKYYPWLYENTAGWMESNTFCKWFEEWEKSTRIFKLGNQNDLQPRLLIYDGHLSSIWYDTIELARVQNVTIHRVFQFDRLNFNLKACCDKWLEGKPNLTAEEIDNMLNKAKVIEAAVPTIGDHYLS